MAEVSKRFDTSDHLSLVIFQDSGRDTDRNALSAGIHDVDGLVDDGRPRLQGFLQGTGALADAGPEDIATPLANSFLSRDTGDPLGSSVERSDLPLLVNGENTIRN